MSTDPTPTPGGTHHLDLPGGRLAYDDTGGNGPLVVCVPGLGDVRGEYRFLAPVLADAGCRVVTVDIRGHGETSTGWDDHSPEAVGADVLALITHLDAGPAVVYGESMAAAAAVWAAAEAPALVRGLVLSGPFVRQLPPTLLTRLLPALTRPGLWARYYRSLTKAAPPADLDDYVAALRANLREPGRLAALKAMLRASKAACEARLPEVTQPTLVLMGTADPDFPDPAAEAALVGERTRGRVVMVEGAGHYPQVEFPDQVAAEVLALVRETSGHVA